MKVSVVIPCFNAAPHVAEAVSSALRQTRPPDEVVLVDDGSTDDSGEIAARAGARVVTTTRRAGVAAARNVGLREARGQLVAWLDADDHWTDAHLATVVPLLERHPTAVLAFSRVRLFGAGEGEWPIIFDEGQPVDAFDASLRRCVLPQNAVVVRREEVLAAGAYDERLRTAEDFDLWLRLSLRHPFVCTHAITAFWRQHERNLGGDLLAYQRSEYESRWRLWRGLVDGAAVPVGVAPRDAAHVARVMREIWEAHLDVAWHLRDRAQMALHLSMHTLVPDSEELVARWRRKARLLPVAATYDRVRAGAARALRGADADGGTAPPA